MSWKMGSVSWVGGDAVIERGDLLLQEDVDEDAPAEAWNFNEGSYSTTAKLCRFLDG